MKILFLTSGRQSPSSRFRVHTYLPHLRRLGHRCVVRASHPPQYESYRSLGWRRSVALRRMLRYGDLWLGRRGGFDVVYVERELFDDDTTDLEERFREACGALVLDLDDAVFLRHPAKYDRLTRLADHVIAGNVYLAERLAPLNARLTVVPTVVDLDQYPRKPQRPEKGPTIVGWTGSSSGLPFVRSIAGALAEVARRRPMELHLIADRIDEPTRAALRDVPFRFRRWRARTELRDLSRFDIGLMPLADDEWNRYKCGLKLLQYWAIGIPAIASPVGVNRDLVRDGENGFLANSHEAWVSSLMNLLDNQAERRRLGAVGRALVEAEFDVRRQLPAWLQAVEQAVHEKNGALGGSVSVKS